MIDKNNIFYGSNLVVEYPEIRLHKFTKDFSWGFYCTNSNVQAEKFSFHRVKALTKLKFERSYVYND